MGRVGEASDDRALIAVSSCLLGEAVRYDGGHKYFPCLDEVPLGQFRFMAVCPEVESGLGVPRPPLRLVRSSAGIRLQAVGNPEHDVTALLERQVRCRVAALEGVSGFILKSRSPSCGIEDVPVFDEAGRQVAQGSGLFVRYLMSVYPALPLAAEVQLLDVPWRDDFLQRVLAYAHHQRQARDA
ncbi:MAG: DUF523 domain-containing protein [Gammaproteobacteria bacterium]